MKAKTHTVSTPTKSRVEIVVSRTGRNLSSMPKSQRAKAKRDARAALERPDWAIAHQDPSEIRHLAHRASNSRDRREPTRASTKRDAVTKSRYSQD